MKNTLILVFSCLSSIILGQQGFTELDREEFSISYPGTWEVNESGQMGMSFALFSPMKFDGDLFRENVNLIIQDISAYDMNLDSFVNLSENQVNTMIQDGNILESKRKGEFHQMIYTGTMGQFKLKFSQRFWVKDGNAYVLTFTAEESEFAGYQEIASQIMDSFVIK